MGTINFTLDFYCPTRTNHRTFAPTQVEKKLNDFTARLDVERKKRLQERKEQRRRDRKEQYYRQKEEEEQERRDQEAKREREEKERIEKEKREKEEKEYKEKMDKLNKQAELQRGMEQNLLCDIVIHFGKKTILG